MRCKWYLFIIFIFSIFLIPNVYAEDCDSTDIKRLRVLANDVDISYEYNDDIYDSDGFKIFDTYKVVVSNLSDELYVIESKTNLDLRSYSVNDGSITIDRLYSGNKSFKIYSKNCSNKLLKTYSIKLPEFNNYSTDFNCEGHEDIEVCQKFYDSSNIDYYEFMEMIEKGDNEDKDKDSTDTNIKENNKFIEFIKDNYIYISIGGGVLILIIIVLIILRHKKRGALE